MLVAVIILAILAVFDLVVGVGNDAVNFLNSAIGSKVASFKTIMWVATAGIFIGALSSAGMMEIAREGIFNPEYFSLREVLTIFLAVMLTDILLLDVFNTIGLPTSTTVSIVFELLGASVIVGAFKLMQGNEPLNWLFNINDTSSGVIGYLNWAKTSSIVSSIFLSVLFAFIFGVVVMFVSRMLFSFNYSRNLKHVGIVWASLAMLAMSYFLIYKGLKSTYSVKELTKQELLDYAHSMNPNASIDTSPETFVLKDAENNSLVFNKKIKTADSGEQIEVYQIFFGNKQIKSYTDTIKDNIGLFLAGTFIFWLLLFFVLYIFAKINPLKIVVFAGTFSLAMAFAGNDLVNFIGVPLAGWQSYDLFKTANEISGGTLSPDTYKMIGLKFPIQTPYLYLFLAGIIMVLTLWFSKKSRKVTETEVRLGTQDEIEERFNSNAVSRGIVQGSLFLANSIQKVVPTKTMQHISRQFTPIPADEADPPAFDLVRASVNLTMASMLIAMGTSLKLPLSTTYVTFMVAMGTSLADRAWGRESATYRIAGVINVILGWFVTAFVAFTVAAILAIILINFQMLGLIGLVLLLIAFVGLTGRYHKKELEKNEKKKYAMASLDLQTDHALQKMSGDIAISLDNISLAYQNAIKGLLEEDKSKIQKANAICADLLEFYTDLKSNLFKAIKKSKLNKKQTAQLYILSNDMMQDILQSLTFIVNATETHVKNAHKPLKPEQQETLKIVEQEVVAYLAEIVNNLKAHDYEASLSRLKEHKRSIFDHLEAILSSQVDGISKKEYGFKNSNLALSIILETKDLVAISVRFTKLIHRLGKGESPLGNRLNN